jgi:hypothetical protein
MNIQIFQRLTWAMVIIAFFGTSAAAWGQESQTPPAAGGQYAAPTPAQQGGDALSPDEIRQRFEQQQQQIAELQNQLKNAQQSLQATPVAETPAQGGATNKQEGEAAKSDYVNNDDMSFQPHLKNGLFLWFETPNKDFTMHLGGWMQWDNVWWD